MILDASVCNDLDILNMLSIVRTIVRFITIMAPVLLVIFVILDIIKTITSADVDTKKLSKSVTARVIAAILVFLVPSILDFVLGVIPVADNSFIACYGATASDKIETTIVGNYLEQHVKFENTITEYEKSNCDNQKYQAAIYEYNKTSEWIKAVKGYEQASYQTMLDQSKAKLDRIKANCSSGTSGSKDLDKKTSNDDNSSSTHQSGTEARPTGGGGRSM